MNIQNGRHYDVITKINGIGHNYKSVNNKWIHLKFKLEIVPVNTDILKNTDFNIFKMVATMTPLPKITEMAVACLIRKVETCK